MGANGSWLTEFPYTVSSDVSIILHGLPQDSPYGDHGHIISFIINIRECRLRLLQTEHNCITTVHKNIKNWTPAQTVLYTSIRPSWSRISVAAWKFSSNLHPRNHQASRDESKAGCTVCVKEKRKSPL